MGSPRAYQQVTHPELHVVLGSRFELGKAKASDVRGNHTELVSQVGHYLAPVGPSRNAGAGSVKQEQRLSRAMPKVIGLMVCGNQAVADSGMLDHGFSSIQMCMCMDCNFDLSQITIV